MADIDIRHKHALPPEEAHALAENVALAVNDTFPIDYHWEGKSLHFQRPGVTGQIELCESEIRIQVHLGFLLRPMKYRFEQAIHRYLRDLFGT